MLKLLIENTLVKVVGMEKGYKILGNYIRLVDERNRNLAITKLLGVSINKKFIPSIANIVGTDLSNYKIVRTGQFAYGPVTSRNGEKISIAYLDEEDCIISSSYTVFEVENKEDRYVMMLMALYGVKKKEAEESLKIADGNFDKAEEILQN